MYRIGLKQDPDFPDIQNNIAWVLQKIGRSQ